MCWLSVKTAVAVPVCALSVLLLCCPESAVADQASREAGKNRADTVPAFKLRRADEDYRYLKATDLEGDFWAEIKRIELGRDVTMSVGGELRGRAELHNNRNWNATADRDYWSHRIALHAGLQTSKNVRFFTELYHGYTSHEEQVANSDALDFHQGFAEYHRKSDGESELSLRAGRQEIGFGKARLMGIREWPNMRRSYDALFFAYQYNSFKLDAYYGREVRLQFDAFDNTSYLFSGGHTNPRVWGLHSQWKHASQPGMNELYYFAYDSRLGRFNDVAGPETRHTIGWRSVSQPLARLRIDFEAMHQFGKLGHSDISAFNADLDAQYSIAAAPGQIDLGLHMQWSSGDNNPGDGEINTYNPMFVNPAPYGLSRVITPANTIMIKPYFRFKPNADTQIYFEYARYWRESKNDGLYRIPRFPARPAASGLSRQIGEQIGLRALHTIGRHWTLELNMSYFRAGTYLKQSGNSDNAVYIVPSLRFRF